MGSFADNLRKFWRDSGILVQLILINVIIFLILNISSNFTDKFIRNLVMPLKPELLLMKPWTFISCLFSHVALSHVFNNMLVLWLVGRIFIVVTGFTHWTKVSFIYIAGGILGNIFLLLFSILLPDFFGYGVAFGASSAVMAIALAVGFYSPNYEVNLMFIGEVKIKWVVMFLFAVTTIVDLSLNTGGKLGHLGGAVFGTIYGIQLKHGKDMSAWFTKLFSSKKRSGLKVVHKRGVSDYEYNEMKHEREKTLDELLDKINKSGYESLSKKEKETLHVLSKK